jgi:hypothetical protein
MLDVPSLEPNSTFPEAEIYNGQMRITWWGATVFQTYFLRWICDWHRSRTLLKECFDVKTEEICNLLDGHIRQMHNKYPGDQIVCESQFYPGWVTNNLHWARHISFCRGDSAAPHMCGNIC